MSFLVTVEPAMLLMAFLSSGGGAVFNLAQAGSASRLGVLAAGTAPARVLIKGVSSRVSVRVRLARLKNGDCFLMSYSEILRQFSLFSQGSLDWVPPVVPS